MTASSGQVMSHLPSASLSHYAALSFVVKGRSQRSELRIANLKKFDDFYDFNELNDLNEQMIIAKCEIIGL